MRACDDEVGRPQYQVIRSQKMAPTRPAKDHPLVDDGRLHHTLAHRRGDLDAEAEGRTKLKNAAHTTACSGVRTRVETTVAIELAASWNPLMKSKTRATMTMKTRGSACGRAGLRPS